jgi:hypothetical protein
VIHAARTLALALLALVPAAARAQSGAQGAPQAGNCAVCHGKENREHQTGIHARGGVTCVSCHGGNPDSLEVDAAHGKDLVSLRNPRAAVESCGKCHADVERMRAFGLRTDQLSLYWTSQHGAKLQKDGDPKVATCTSCHGVHAVLSASSPLAPVSRMKQVETCGRCHADAKLMSAYGIPADVVEQFRGSVHGQALLEQGSSAAPACIDCHGSHGAVPPRMADVSQVCGHCHSTVEAFYAGSAHAKRGKAAVQCVSCHSNHAVRLPSPAMFLGDDPGHCGACHADEKDPARAVAAKLHEDVQKLAATIASADRAVHEAGGRGLFLGAERGYIDQARGLLVRARAMTHTLSPEALEDILNRGQGMVGQTTDGLATKNRIFRDRKIFTSIFLGISLAFAILLWMYGLELRSRGVRRRKGG